MENAQTATPEQIAQSIFAIPPGDPMTNIIVSENSGQDAVYLFELVITIFMEGLGVLTHDLDSFDLNNLNANALMSVQPWLNSMGLRVKVTQETKDSMGFDYYCRVTLKKQETTFFEMKGINKFYTFRLNGNAMEAAKSKTNLKDIHALFRNGDDHWKISFDFYQ